MSSTISGNQPPVTTPLPSLQTNNAGPSNATQTSQSLRRPGNPSALLGGLSQAPGAGGANEDTRARLKTDAVRGRSPVTVSGEIIGNSKAKTSSSVEPDSGEFAVRGALKKERDAAARAHVTLTADLGAFRENFKAVKALVGEGTQLSAVVKADAYGIGAVKVAQALEKEGCDKFFVAALDEALTMRQGVKPETTVFVLGGPLAGTARQFAENNITPVLNSLSQVEEWNKLGEELGRKLPAILQFDTGMSRQGIAPEDRSKVAHGSDALSNIDIKYVMSHLATASEATLDENNERVASQSMEAQRAVFDQVRSEYPGVPASLAASSALHVKDYQYDMVRVGGAIHGQHLFDDGQGRYKQPVTVTGRLAETRPLNEGARIGYGLVYGAGQGEHGGTIQAGYTDGVQRGLGSSTDDNGRNVTNGHVKIDGHLAPITGNVSMDTTTVDLTGAIAAKKQALRDQLNAPREPGVDIDSRLASQLHDLDTEEGIRKTFTNANVVFSDADRPFDDLAAEAKDGGDKRINVSKVSIDFGTSPRVRRTYVDHTDRQNAAPVQGAARRAPSPLTAEELEQMRHGEIPNTEPPLTGTNTGA